MGACGSKEGVGTLEKSRSFSSLFKDGEARRTSAVDKKLKAMKDNQVDDVQLLIMGTGGCGKSTFFKQIQRILQGEKGDWTTEEKVDLIPQIHINMYDSILKIVEQTKIVKRPQRNISEANRKHCEMIAKAFEEKREFQSDIWESLRAVWADPAIQQTYSEAVKDKFWIDDNTEFYFSKISEFAGANFLPKTEHLLRIRMRTTGIIEKSITHDNKKITFIDVGGQRNERKKWFRKNGIFENSKGILYVIALNEYDIVTFEDDTANAMQEALQTFEQVCESPAFQNVPIVIFFNKTDLLAEKLEKGAPLSYCFEEYVGPNTRTEVIQYIKDQFMLRCDDPRRIRKVYQTNFTNTDELNSIVHEFLPLFDVATKDSFFKEVKPQKSPRYHSAGGSLIKNYSAPQEEDATT